MQKRTPPTAGRDELMSMIAAAGNIVAFTGAGLSTECGIPDFRSPGGIWTENKPINFDEYLSDPEARKEGWRRKFKLDEAFRGVTPGRGHMAIATLAAAGKLSYAITQNIDNLHQMSGLPEAQIIELHGNGSYATCLSCAQRYEIDWVRTKFEPAEIPPDCTECGGLIKSATISFGQSMPENEMIRARSATLDADLFLAIGSSLVVYPAAGFPLLAKENGAKLVILNRDKTDLDPYADLVINEDIGTMLAPLIKGAMS